MNLENWTDLQELGLLAVEDDVEEHMGDDEHGWMSDCVCAMVGGVL